MYTLYQLTNKINGKFYIGYTSETPQERFKKHLRDSKKCDFKFARALKKYGAENFNIKTLAVVETLNEALALEIKIIEDTQAIKRGYNSNQGGRGGNTGNYEQVSKKLKEYFNKNPDVRKHKTKEHIEKQKHSFMEFLKTPEGQLYKDERRQRMLGGGPGKIKTEETCKKISEAKRGKASWVKMWKLIHPDGTEEIFKGLKEPCEKYHLKSSDLSAVANGRQHTHKGFKCAIVTSATLS